MSMPPHGDHPELEALAAFAEGRTGGRERQTIVAHLAQCAECYTLVAETGAYLQLEPQRERSSSTGKAAAWWLAAAAGLLLVMALGFFARAHRTDRLAEVAAAASTEHPLHVRLSGGVAPGREVMRGEAGQANENENVLRLYLELKKLRQTDDSPQTLHAFGLAALLLGRNDEAIEVLQKAAARSSDAATLSDLAAAHQARWEASAASADLDQAETLSKKALTLEPNRAETLFNRAEILEAEGDRMEAIALWKRYLAADTNPAWAAIARKRLQQLSAPTLSEGWAIDGPRLKAGLAAGGELRALVDRYPQQCRLLVEEELLPLWASKVKSGDASASQTLQIAKAISVELDRRGDALPRETVLSSESASNEARARLADGLLAYARGRAAMKNGEHEPAKIELRKAVALLSDGHSPFVVRAWIALASNDFHHTHFDVVLAEVQHARSCTRDIQRFTASDAQLEWLEGLCQTGRGQLVEAVHVYRESAYRFDRLGEIENSSSVRGLLAEALEFAGDPVAAEEQRRVALAGLTRLGDFPRLSLIAGEAAEAALGRGNLDQAFKFYKKICAATIAKGSADSFIYAAIGAADISMRKGNTVEAQSIMKSAEARLEDVTEPGRQLRLRTELKLARSRAVAHPSDFQVYDELTALLRSEGNHFRVASLLLEKGEHQLALRQFAAGDATLRGALTELQTVRAGVHDPVMQARFFETGSGVLDALVTSFIAQQRPISALMILQRGGVGLGPEPAGQRITDGAGTDPHTLLHAVPPGVVAIQYKVIGRRLLIWAIADEQLSFSQSNIDPAVLRAAIGGLRAAALEGRMDLYDGSAAKVYAALLAPVQGRIAHAQSIVIVADAETANVPFGALRKNAASPFLVETASVVYAPSIAALMAPARSRPSLLRSVALFGSPLMDRKLYPDLPPLPEVGVETASIAKLYPSVAVLTGARASRPALLAAMRSSDVIHVAVHAIANTRVPYLSSLILSPHGNDHGALYAEEIARTRVRSRLVVLSGCSTAVGARLRTEGMTGLASAFLAGGAEEVLATSWPIADSSAASLTTEFHRGIRNGVDGARALQHAQLRELRAAVTPRERMAWIPYQLFVSTGNDLRGRS